MIRILLTAVVFLFSAFAIAQNKKYYYEYESVLPYQERFDKIEVNATNEVEKIQLYGTLLLPKTPFYKVVMIIPGSGPDTRENHFKLAEELLLHNIAVFRYDERGISESEGEFNEIRIGINELVDDMAVLFQKLKQLPALKDKKVGVIGHSFGGMIAIDAVNKKKANPDFMVQWATPVQSHGEWFKYQLKNGIGELPMQFKYENLEEAYKIMDIFNQAFATTKDSTTMKQDIKLLYKTRKIAKKQGYTSKRYERFTYATFPTHKALIKKDFEKMYANVEVPMLYIIGTNDIIVDPVAGVEKLKSLGNTKVEIKVLDGLDHYLTTEPELVLGKEMYYIDEKASAYMVNWILNQ
ncbi:alpha/beta hydrolase [Myroides indicus]|uniref:Serine aminopeptidase S33 domain-containing protein n=1 Tax=Myroides indicus TaxID=1323422 RepID=A0A4R7F0B1_9FLAO|nr:alpha/beta hydrolase [Myroides indicus]TDS60188.1 hypothetical protein C8P70_10945 [Myroides indicus]